MAPGPWSRFKICNQAQRRFLQIQLSPTFMCDLLEIIAIWLGLIAGEMGDGENNAQAKPSLKDTYCLE